MIELTATEIVTFAATVAGAILIPTLLWALSPRRSPIKSPAFFWSCGCRKVPLIADKPLVVRK